MISQDRASLVLVFFDHLAAPYTPVDLGYVKAFVEARLPGVHAEIVRADIAYIDGAPGANDLFRLRDTALALAERCADGAHVVLFLDNIVWTLAFYLEGAKFFGRMLKRARRGVRLGLQSYKVSEAAGRDIFATVPEIDFIVRGEPEDALARLVAGEAPARLPNVASRDGGAARFNPEAPLRPDLDELPSPFLSGAMEGFVDPRRTAMATARGCPYACAFCHRGVRLEAVRTFSLGRVMDELEWLAGRGVERLFVLDDCFVVSRQRFVDMVAHYERRFAGARHLPGLEVMCRPEVLDERLVAMFPAINVASCQIGLQTVSPAAGKHMGRHGSLAHLEDVVRWLRAAGVAVQLDVILGLPDDTLDGCIATLERAAALRPARLQVKQLYRNAYTAFDLAPERYGLQVEAQRYLYHVPYFAASATFSNDDVRRASDYAASLRHRLAGTSLRLWSQFHQFSDFEAPPAAP